MLLLLWEVKTRKTSAQRRVHVPRVHASLMQFSVGWILLLGELWVFTLRWTTTCVWWQCYGLLEGLLYTIYLMSATLVKIHSLVSPQPGWAHLWLPPSPLSASQRHRLLPARLALMLIPTGNFFYSNTLFLRNSLTKPCLNPFPAYALYCSLLPQETFWISQY